MFEKFALGKKNNAEDIKFKSFGEAIEDAAATDVPMPKEEPKAEGGAASNIELKIARPESFAEVSTIADYLLDGCTVVLNMELIEKPTALRMLDFLNGVTYSLGGDIKNAAPGTYIITPHNVDITD